MSDSGLGLEREFTIAADHPAFAGHFPGAPVLPGVVLLSLVMQVLAEAPELSAGLGAAPQIDQVKFLHPVGPGQTLRVSLAAQGHGVGFAIHLGLRIVVTGRLSGTVPGL